MKSRLNILITLIITTCLALVCPAAEILAPANPNRYLNAVRTFADNVLKYGRDKTRFFCAAQTGTQI